MKKSFISLEHNNNHMLLPLILLFIFLGMVQSYSLCTTTQSSCLTCPIQCTKCNSTFVCTSCAYQYYLSSSACLPCSEYCLNCTSSTVCLQCQSPYVLSNGTCQQCIIDNALTCSSTVSASSCRSQYYVNQNYCSSCLLNCKTCTSSSTCTQCIDNFYLNNTVLTCNPCPINCLSCNQFTPTICTSCKNGYLLNSSTSTCTLIDCSGLTNCQYCSSTNICGRCSIYYYWDGNACVIGASILCGLGAVGPLSSHCINDCQQIFYKSQNSTPFVCIPYKTAKISTTVRVSQAYYNAYSDETDFQNLSLSSNTKNLESNGQYSFQISQLFFNSTQSFYKIQMRIKYISLSGVTLQISSVSQASPYLIQAQSTNLPSTLGNINVFSYLTHTIHSNNFKINVTNNNSVKVIQFYYKIYRCPQSCLQCLNYDLCQLCREPNYMLGYECVSNCTVYYHFALNRTCLLNCPDGYYYKSNGTNNKFCEVCSSPCKNCVNSTMCLSCVNAFYFYNYTCITTCPDGYYKNALNLICDTCISPCKKCTSKTDCLSCDIGFWNGTECTIRCSNGTYGDNTTKTCQLCDSNCVTCSNTSTTCTSCSIDKHLYNKKCVTACPNRFYSSGTVPLTCISCKPPCSTCTSLNSCLTCSYNYLFQSNSTCISSCPDGYYQNLINNTCTLCASNCLTCEGSSGFCTSCNTSQCLYQGKCVTSCPTSQWYRVINSTNSQCKCQQCKYPCKLCSNQSSCLSCLQGYLYGVQCLSQCPNTYYKNQTLKSCFLCNTLINYCSQCTSQNCTLCESGYLLHLGACISLCPTLYYQLNQKCNKCIAPCLDCVSFSQCKSCIDSYILFNGQCIISCPVGKYSYNVTTNSSSNITVPQKQCASCQSPCLYCTQAATKCTFCITNYNLYQNLCYQNCSTILPLNTLYNQAVTSTCTKCLFPCKTCTSQYQCTSCTIGYLNVNYKKCQQCSVGTFPNSTLGLCVQCPVECVICYQSNFCTVCADGYYLFQNMCTSNLTLCQSNGYYGIGRVCTLCQQPCKTCSIYGNNCTSCLSGYISFSPNQCITECPTGYFRNSATSNCDLCSSQCVSCLASSTYCFSCSTGYKLYSVQMKCVSTCPQYTYLQSNFCITCKYPCLTCSGQSTCTSCITGTLVGTSCLSSCSSGYFSNSSNICQQCQSPCKQCSKASTNCTQCPSGSYLYQNQCLSICPATTFAQTQSLKCISCLGTCHECQDHINCTSCTGGLLFYISTTTNYGQCVSSCPNGYYPVLNISQCQACRSDCLTCQNSSSCLLCNGGKVMYLGSCYTQCPSQMYTYQGRCQNCQSPCYNCSDTTTCTSCMNNSFLLVGSAQCIEGPICPVGYYLLDGQAKCNSQCPSGYYHILTNRTCNINGCEADYFKGSDYQCYNQCPSGYIGNKTLYCQSCVGSQCYNGLYFSLDYLIKNDDLIVTLQFTQTPLYLISTPLLTITPNIAYNLSSNYLVSSVASSLLQQVNQSPQKQPSTQIKPVSSTYYQGSTKLQFHLNPTESFQETYFKVKFLNHLQTFQNPLQKSSSTFFIEGYDLYDNSSLMNLNILGLLAFTCSLIGLVKNPLITDFGQVLFILGLNNIHYPFHLRTFLQSTKLAWLHGFINVDQQNMYGKGKFAYVVNQGLLSNCLGNIVIIIIGLFIALLGFGLMKFLQWYVEYRPVSSNNMISPHQQSFIPQKKHQQQQNKNNNTQQAKQQYPDKQKSLPKSVVLLNFLTKCYSSYNLKLYYLNRLVYFNYLPISLFTFTQLASFDTSSSSINMISSFLSIITLLVVVLLCPFLIVRQKPKFTFLYARKAIIALSLLLSINYPAYCIGIISVCNITAILLILSYKLQKWKQQRHINALGQSLQLLLMIGFAIFVMIGEGYKTSFKLMFGWVIIILAIIIMLVYILFSLFLFVLWLIKMLCHKDYINEWIQADKLDDSDGTDSQTLNSSMKDHQQKKDQNKQKQFNKNKQQQMNWNNIQNILKKNDNIENDKYMQGQINEFLQTRQMEISPNKQDNKDQHNNELFWNYDTSSQQNQDQQGLQRKPPKMLIRCVNDFSDFEQQDRRNHHYQNNNSNSKEAKNSNNNELQK